MHSCFFLFLQILWALEFDFYKKMCPQLPLIVEKVMMTKFAFDPTSAKIQLCSFFHDCFMQRCDASILINSTNVNQAKKNVTINFSLGNFFVINNIKKQLEKECPSVVSCINILALVVVYFVM
jgi:peroxidase